VKGWESGRPFSNQNVSSVVNPGVGEKRFGMIHILEKRLKAFDIISSSLSHNLGAPSR